MGRGPTYQRLFKTFNHPINLKFKESFDYHIFFIINQTLVKFTTFLTNCFDFSGDNNKKTEGALLLSYSNYGGKSSPHDNVFLFPSFNFFPNI